VIGKISGGKVEDFKISYSGYKTYREKDMHLENEKLTNREQEVALLVSEGLTNPKIAKRLKISKHTVKHYLTVIYQKLNIQCRYQLIRYVIEKKIKFNEE